MGLPYLLISWGGLGVNLGIYGIHGLFGIWQGGFQRTVVLVNGFLFFIRKDSVILSAQSNLRHVPHRVTGHQLPGGECLWLLVWRTNLAFRTSKKEQQLDNTSPKASCETFVYSCDREEVTRNMWAYENDTTYYQQRWVRTRTRLSYRYPR